MLIEIAVRDDDGAETGRLFVRNLPYLASEEDLANVFQEYGEVVEVEERLVRCTCGNEWGL